MPKTKYTLVLIRRGDNIVMVDHRRGLNLPGGHVERGESFAQCAVREVKEETGLDVTVLERAIVEFPHALIKVYEAITVGGYASNVHLIDRHYASTFKSKLDPLVPLLVSLLTGGAGRFYIRETKEGFLVRPETQ